MSHRRFAAIWLLAVGILLSVSAPAAGLEFVTVRAEGLGQTQAAAINAALTRAVTQVNGAHLAATTMTAEVLQAIDTDTESSVTASSTSAEAVALRTKGVIRQYRVVSLDSQDGSWLVKLDVTVVQYTPSPQADRLRLAIMPFRASSEDERSLLEPFIAELTNHLTQSRKFALLDRQFDAERQSELGIIASADTRPEEWAKLGNRLGTDYLIAGIIEDAGSSTRSTVIQSVGREIRTTETRARISYRVIDVATGQVKFADTWGKSSEGTDLRSLASQGAAAVAQQILDAIFPLMVEHVSGDLVYLGQGGKSIRVGQKYRLLQYGGEIRDSYTGESLGREELDVGMVEIVDVQSKVAKARVVKATVDMTEAFAPQRFILRLMAEAPRPATTSPPAAVVHRQEKAIEQKKKDAEKEW